MSAIEFRNFSYAYKGTTKVLDDVSLTIAKGSFTAIAGPSGAGKTTLCLALSGVVPHYFGGSVAGEVLVGGGATIASTMGKLASAVGTVLEDYDSQLVTMTVEEEIAFALECRGMEHGAIKQAVAEALAKVGLKGLERREVATLSGGQRQRLVIASVLATKPGILVLDEPASALDPEGAEELYGLLADLNREHGITIVVVEHDLSRVLAHADKMVVLTKGRIAARGGCGEVLSYMWAQEELKDMVPPLWAVKLTMEQDLGSKFTAWRREADAVTDIAEHLARRGEASRSA